MVQSSCDPVAEALVDYRGEHDAPRPRPHLEPPDCYEDVVGAFGRLEAFGPLGMGCAEAAEAVEGRMDTAENIVDSAGALGSLRARFD